jgi:hypothetical protein
MRPDERAKLIEWSAAVAAFVLVAALLVTT